MPDAGLTIVPGARGGSCSAQLPCEASLTCAALAGGYCTSACGDGEACDGACVDTPRWGELCAAKCTTDADCRTDEAYVCDPQWHACLLPNLASIVPASCPAGKGPVVDAGFAASEPWPNIEKPPLRGKDALYVLDLEEEGLRVRASRDGGKTFGASVIALAGTYGNAAVGSDGKLHIVTINGNLLGAFGSAHQKIEYTVSSDRGASFAAPVTISGRDEVIPFLFSNPSVAVDTARKWLYAAYVRGGRDANWEIVVAASKDAGVTWKRTKLAGDGCAIHMVPHLALDPATGTLHVAYYDNEGVPGRFVHASCGPGLTRCAAHGAINSVPFATLSTVRQSSKSIGQYQSLVVDAKRRVLHAVWTQPVDEGGKIVARIFHAQAKLKK